MSAIVGLCWRDGRPVDRTELERMTACLAHRGPDGSGTWQQGAVGFGHRLLCTTPEALGEHLPLVNANGDLTLTTDARLDNRAELMTALGIASAAADTMTDSELILRAYERWGDTCPERLLGDFAFAIWDARQQRLFCARDPLGVRPFYYHHDPHRGFAFASEIKALFTLPGVPRRLNETRVGDYLEGMLDDKAITFYEGICRLPPGHTLTLSEGQLRLRPYWTPAPARELRLRTFDDYAEAYREVFTAAVQCRLRSTAPVGTMLSGGLDSSSIAGVARKLLAAEGNGLPLHTFSAIFDDVPQCDERPYINAVLAQGGMEAHFVHGDRISPLADLDRMLWHQDEAFFTFNLFLNWSIWGVAQQAGVRVLLDGFVGDTTIPHGLTHLIELAQTFRWPALAREVTQLTRRHHEAPWRTLRYYVWHHSLKPHTPAPLRKAWRWLRRYPPSPAQRTSPILRPDFAQRIRLGERVRAFQGNGTQRLHSAREYHRQDVAAGVIPFALEVTNKAAAAFNIEVRFPFTDRRLVEFCLALPPQYKLHQGWPRAIVRRALADALPDKVRWRLDKADISANFQRGLLAFEKERIERTLFDDASPIAPYVHLPALRQAYRQYTQGAHDTTVYVWLAVTLAAWLQTAGLSSSGDFPPPDGATDKGIPRQRVAALAHPSS